MEQKFINELKKIEQQYQKLDSELTSPELIKNLSLYSDKQIEINQIEGKYKQYVLWKLKHEEIKEWEEISLDATMYKNAKIEIVKIKNEIETIEEKIAKMFAGKQEKLTNLIVEIRGAAGGEEGNLFAKDIAEAYLKTAKKQKWKTEILGENKSTNGGYAFFSFSIKANNGTNEMLNEGGVHRVQRIPKTESQGRTHTSTITVAVLKEVKEKDFPLASKDLRIDTFKSSGAGGQHVNTTDSAIRIVHIPTGLTVTCQDGRSQHDNKDKGMKILRARLYDMQQKKQQAAKDAARSKQVGVGNRSEKIRTYNYQQNRITDHRYNVTLKNIEKIMNGEFDIVWKKINEVKDETINKQ